MMKKTIRYLGIIFLVVLSILVINTVTSKVNANTYQTRMNLEEPQNNIKSSKKVQLKGWVMSSSPSYSIKVYLNDKEVSTITNRVVRNDVLNAIKDSGGSKYNPKPGYLQTIDLSSYDSGTYTLGLKVIDNKSNQLLEQTQRIINLQSHATTMNLELPTNRTNSK